MAEGREIGTQTVAAHNTLEVRVPDGNYQNWETFPTQPTDTIPADNIRVNTNGKWEIVQGPNGVMGNILLEGSSYEYGSNLTVEARWWKRAEIIIWCYGHDNDAQTDLIPYVHVANGHETGTPNDYYGFFGDGETANFSVSGTGNNNVIYVSGSDTYYKFIGWKSTEPELFSTNMQPITWCGNDGESTTHIHQNLTFSPMCLKNEYAVFLYGQELEINVRTNVVGFNQSPYQYKVTWLDNNTVNSQIFGSSITLHADDTHIGSSFYCQSLITSGLGVYVLQGWYVGEYNGGTDPSAFSNIVNSDNFISGDISQTIHAICTPIILTAIYMPSTDQYTITYHSGL